MMNVIEEVYLSSCMIALVFNALVTVAHSNLLCLICLMLDVEDALVEIQETNTNAWISDVSWARL